MKSGVKTCNNALIKKHNRDSVLTRNQWRELALGVLPDRIVSSYISKEPTREQVFGRKSKHRCSTYLRKDSSLGNNYLSKGRAGEKTAYISMNLESPNLSADIPTDRPIAKYGKPTPKSKTPGYVITPKGSKLRRSMCNGVIATYNNRSALNFEDKTSHALSERPINLLPASESTAKHQEIIVTKETLLQQHPIDRCQQSVMATHGKVKAADAAKASGVYQEKDVWHWMHLISYKLGGKQFQTPANLVAGSAEANTQHRILELEIENIIGAQLDKANVTAVADHDDNYVASSLRYRIKTEAFDFTFAINTQTHNKPTAIDADYVHYFLKHLMSLHTEKATAPESSGYYVAREAARKPSEIGLGF